MAWIVVIIAVWIVSIIVTLAFFRGVSMLESPLSDDESERRTEGTRAWEQRLLAKMREAAGPANHGKR